VAEVTGLKTTPVYGGVEMSWEPPPQAKGIEVWCQPNTPPARGEGSLVDHVTMSYARNLGLQNGQPHGFRIVAVFDGPEGEPVYSDGLICVVTPGEQLPPAARSSHEGFTLTQAVIVSVIALLACLGVTVGNSGSRPKPEKEKTVALVAKETTPTRPAGPRFVHVPPPKPDAERIPEREPEPGPAVVRKPQPQPANERPIVAPDPVPARQPAQTRPTKRNTPEVQRPQVVPLEGEEALLFTYPPADQNQWELAWRKNLKVHVTLKLSGRMSGSNKALPTVVGLQSVQLENTSPFLIRIVGGPAKNLESSSRKGLEVPPNQSLALQDPTRHTSTLSTDLRVSGDRGGTVAAVRRGPLCTIEVVPGNGQPPLRLRLEYAISVNRDNDVLSARYTLTR
jgi:hypothetical protein